MRVILVLLWFVFVFIDFQPAYSQDKTLPYKSGITGAISPVENENPAFYFKRQETQDLIDELAKKGPQKRSSVEHFLTGTSTTIDDLITVGLLREENEILYINFALFTTADQELLFDVIPKFSDKMVASYHALDKQIIAQLDQYPIQSVRKGILAFIIIGAFSLDWDGLEITAEDGYRLVAPKFKSGGGHFFWAVEKNDTVTLREIYWGSHNYPFGQYDFVPPVNYTFTSFGDHFTSPRAEFPDLFWFSSDLYDEDLSAVSNNFLSADHVVSEDFGAIIADILFAMRAGLVNIDEISEAVGQSKETVAELLSFLEEIQYVSNLEDGQYALQIPVFTIEDKPMIDNILKASWGIIDEWHTQYYDSLHEALADLTSLKQGVDFREVYVQIWHYIFGITNRDLARSGFFVHPYGIEKKYPGAFGAVWERDVYDLCKVILCE